MFYESTSKFEMHSPQPEAAKRHRHRESSTKGSPTTVAGYAFVVLKNLPGRKPWHKSERIHLSITEEELDMELAKSQEQGKDAASVMSMLPSKQLKHITKLQADTNLLEKSSRYEWRVVALSQDKPTAEFGNVPQTMWAILKREKLEKSERAEKKAEKSVKRASKHRRSKATVSEESVAQSHEELQRCFYERYMKTDNTTTSTIPAIPSAIEPLTPPASDSDSSSSSEDADLHSGYSSDASDTCSTVSNLTTGSSASSETSIATPPNQRVPLRGILRTSRKTESESGSTSSELSLYSEKSCSSGVNPSPLAFSYVALAPHATQPVEVSDETSTALTVTRKCRFSNEASFCLAFDYYDEYQTEEESEAEETYYRSLKRSRREGGERLAVSRYVTYGSD